MHVSSPLAALFVVTLVAPAAIGAQARGSAATRDTVVEIPRAMMPPAGKCRIWMVGVPAAQQPAPTDCTTALRQKPANGILVFGPAKRDLSPFDVRNPWGPNGSETLRRTAARRDSSGADPRTPTRGRTAGTPPPRTSEPATRQVPTTRTAPVVRETPPAETRQPPPPPPKKPENP